MKIGKLLKYLMLILALLIFVGCDEDEPIVDNDPELFLYSDSILLYAGDSKKIEYFVEGIEEFEIEIKVLNEEIAIVENEVVYGLTGGETKVEVKIKGYDNTLKEITVKVIGGGQISREIMAWVKEEIGTDLTTSIILPKNHPTYQSAIITYTSSNPEVLTPTGITYPKQLDEEVTLTIKVEYMDDILISNYKVNVVGEIVRNIIKDFNTLIGAGIISNINFNSIKNKHSNANITITSSNTDVLKEDGTFTRPDNDEEVTLSLNIELPNDNYNKTFTFKSTARGLDILEKTIIVKDEVIAELGLENNYYRVNSNLDLPDTSKRFGGKITWSSNKPDIITLEGTVNKILVNTYVELFATFTYNGEKSTFTILVEVLGGEYADKWQTIEEFLTQYIFKDEIEVFKYRVTGVGPEYIASNDGYLQFYINKDLEVVQDILEDGHPFRPKRRLDVRYITIHDTAGNTQGAGVEAHSRFIKSTDRSASSWHFTIDDTLLYQHIPLNEVAWHAGTADGNNYSIGIETCTNPDSDYDVVILRTAKLVAMLLDQFDLTLANVRQHYHWSGKNCPQVIIQNNRWMEVIDLIAVELFGRKYLSDVEFVWESLNKDILNDQGIVINHPGQATNVSYKVTVTYNGETRTYTHTSLLQTKK